MNSSRELAKQLWPRLTALRVKLQAGMQGGLGTLAALNLTVPQAMALFRLAEGPQTISQLQAATGRSQAATSHLVAALERKKLARRGDDTADGRRTVVQLTEKARALLHDVEGLRVRSFERLMVPVPAPLLRRLDDAVAGVLAALEDPP